MLRLILNFMVTNIVIKFFKNIFQKIVQWIRWFIVWF